MKTILMALMMVASFAASAKSTAKITAAPADGAVEFEALGRPSMVKIKGKGEGPEAKLAIEDKKLSGELVFKMETLVTGINMRDEHMKEKYLEVPKYPKAVLKLQDVKLPDGFSLQNPEMKEFPFKGKLTLHGVEKDVEGKVSVAKDLKADANFEIKISDFGVTIPSYLGITVADNVKVHVAMNKLTASEAQP